MNTQVVKHIPPASPPYRSIVHAYQHLLPYTDYSAVTRRPDNDWVVAYFERTGAYRLFPTLDSLAQMYNHHVYKSSVIVSKLHLESTMQKYQAREVLKNYGVDITPEDDPFEMLWNYWQKNGDRVGVDPNKITREMVKQDEYVVMIHRLDASTIAKFPKQCRIILTELKAAEVTKYSSKELSSFMRDLVISKKLKTKQNPDRVLAFYLPQLADHGLVVYKRKDYGKDYSAVVEE
jgi:hypothetical protein